MSVSDSAPTPCQEAFRTRYKSIDQPHAILTGNREQGTDGTKKLLDIEILQAVHRLTMTREAETGREVPSASGYFGRPPLEPVSEELIWKAPPAPGFFYMGSFLVLFWNFVP